MMRSRKAESPKFRRLTRSLALVLAAGLLSGQQLTLPNKPDTFHFAVIGDSGSGEREEFDVASQIVAFRARFPFKVVLMMGDNLYGGQKERDYQKKFELPYKALLDDGVRFYASLGNHDDRTQSAYKGFNMNGKRFYTFSPKRGIQFFALDSNYMDKEQLEWLETELPKSKADWKICFFHHPLYSSGGAHGSSLELRRVLEPLFLQYGVGAVFAGHEHFYERMKPQQGIYYFISGAASKLRRSDIRQSEMAAAGFDQDNSFMLLEIDGDQMYFQTISRTGRTVDSGVAVRRKMLPQVTQAAPRTAPVLVERSEPVRTP
jgi:3',5'-cyclic AMP phosphodiesterase CpdA